MSSHQNLEGTCKQFLDSLLANSQRHTLCLNVSAEGFAAEQIAAEYLTSKREGEVVRHTEPSPTKFTELLSGIAGKSLVVDFDDLDKHPKCIDILAEHVTKPDPGGRLVVVSRHWNSDNTAKERELRKHCLFYQQTAAPSRKGA